METVESLTTNNKAVIYIRVSTNEQGEKKLSPEYQKEQALKYIDEYNENIHKENLNNENGTHLELELYENNIFEEIKPASTVFKNYIDNNLEESLKNRPLLQHIIDLAQNKKIGHLIVLSRDRLTRDFQQFITLKYILNKNNVKIHYTRPGENINIQDKKINRFVDNILASVAELEANVISIRVKGGSRIAVKNGYWAGGRPPYGYLIEKTKVIGRSRPIAKLKPSIYEKNIITNIFRLYSLGYGYRKIAKLLNTQCNNTTWTKGKIESIIKNETYTGYITWDRRGGRRHPGKHSETIQSGFIESLCFIDKSYWDTLVKLRSFKTKIKDPKYYDTPYLLKNKLVCGLCGKKLTTKNYGKNKDGIDICVYRCKKDKSSKYELVLNKELIEDLVISELKHSLHFESTDISWNKYCEEKENKLTELNLLIKELDERISYSNSLITNIKFMFKDLTDTDLTEYVVTNTKESKNADTLAASLKSDLAGHLIYQETLLSKVLNQYIKEKENKIKEFNKKYIITEDEFKKYLSKFIINIDNLDTRNKRIFIDLLVDSVTVTIINEKPSIKIIVNPFELIR